MCLAVPGRITEVRGEGLFRNARVDFGGVFREVSLLCLPEAQTGDHVLVHAGIAIRRLDEAQAARTLLELETLEEEAPC